MKTNNLLNWMKDRNVFLDNDNVLIYSKMKLDEINSAAFIMPESYVSENFNPHLSNTTIADIEEYFCKVYGIDRVQFKSRTRKMPIRQARQLAHFFARILTNHSTGFIGKYLGGRDHATVLHSCKVISNEILNNREVADKVEAACFYFNIPVSRVFDF